MACEDVAGDERVLAGGRLGDPEHERQVQRVGPGGERLVEDAVAANALDADAVALQVPLEEAPADRIDAERCLPRDQDVTVRGVRPCGAPVVKPGPQGLVAEAAEPLGVARDRDPPVGQVDVGQVRTRIATQRAACTAARATITRRAGPETARSTALISSSSIGSRLAAGRSAFSRRAGLAKIRLCFFANTKSDRTAQSAVQRG